MNYTIEVRNLINNKNLKYIIYTMGCSLNENDSEKISGMLEEMGFSKTENLEDSDFVIFNTCCVRENAEERLFGKIGEIKKLKESKDLIIAIGGCMMQEKEMLDKIKKSYRYVDIVFGTHTMQDLPKVERTTLTMKETAEYLGISYWLVNQLVRRKQIPCARVGGRVLSVYAW